MPIQSKTATKKTSVSTESPVKKPVLKKENKELKALKPKIKVGELVEVKEQLEMTGSENFEFKKYKGKNIILYFYPKDSTPGCTQEGHDFTALKSKFNKLNTVILGVSRDSLKSHEKFKTKQSYNFELISDPDEILCRYFGVMQPKSMFGRKYMGVERCTFIIDSKQKLIHEWRKVKVPGHADEVFKTLKQNV